MITCYDSKLLLPLTIMKTYFIVFYPSLQFLTSFLMFSIALVRSPS
jgi:hypothetical protein